MARGLKESKGQKKISHHRRIIDEQTIQEKLLLPGLVVRFAYNKAGVYDRRPLIFVFYNDGSLVYGLNLNYLHESRVQRFAKLAQSLTPITMENILGLKKEYPRLQLSTKRKATAVDGKLLYKTIIPRDKFYKDAYRTYRLDVASSMKLVNYDWDVISTQTAFGKTTAEAIKRTGLIDDGDVESGI